MDEAEYDDLRAFEGRLTQIFSNHRASAFRWRIVLFVMTICTAISGFFWHQDPCTNIVPLAESLWNHPIFTVAAIAQIVTLILGILQWVRAAEIIAARTRRVLAQLNMSCDDTGKLILNPRQDN